LRGKGGHAGENNNERTEREVEPTAPLWGSSAVIRIVNDIAQY